MPQPPIPNEEQGQAPGTFNMVQVPPPEETAQKLLKIFPEWSPEVAQAFAETEAGDEAATAAENGDHEEAQGMYEKFYNDAGLGADEAMSYPTKFQEPSNQKSYAPGPAPQSNKVMKTNMLTPQQAAIMPEPQHIDDYAQESTHPKDDPEAYQKDYNYEDNYPGPSYPPNGEQALKQIIGELADSTVSGDDLHQLLGRRAALDPQEFYRFLSSGAMPRALVDSYGKGAVKNSDLQGAYQRYIDQQDINPVNDPDQY